MLKDSYLHLLLIEFVTKKDDLFVFGVSIHFRKSFQASFANSSRELGCEDGCFNNERSCCINNVGILGLNLCLEFNKTIKIIIQSNIIAA